eukprot:CAMPEP_0114517302 /NCGR_PEP_ID=MMETSP0109-20121206/17816_1 /TAXON_ID=29199 /ORGANISM="Chlorarachnion reptans, Strain CCCM449" /LENGTH=110 /DNA_ID=CAMNT_0001697803 /DNA_START=9 /DNA_END=341 /DNA_ORIENTATION=-
MSSSAGPWTRDEQRVRWSLGDDARTRDKADLWSKKQCVDLVKQLATCMSGKTVTLGWECQKERNLYTSCLKNYTSDTYLEMHKRESIAKRLVQMQQAKELEKSIRLQSPK